MSGVLAKVFRVDGFEAWRSIARTLLDEGVRPADVTFVDGNERQQLLEFDVIDDVPATPRRAAVGRHSVSKRFVPLARTVAYHREPTRWKLLYRLLWRLTHGIPRLLEIDTDDDVFLAQRMEKQVRRDAHKMKAFVRF